MSFNPFNFSRRNKTEINTFLRSTFQDDWNYLDALGLNKNELEEVPFEQILNNPDDLVDGVTKVELKLRTRFFDLFEHLIIKHRCEGDISLMFFADVHQSAAILSFYHILKTNLGGGFIKESKFSSFDEANKVEKLAEGKFEKETDEIMHTWLNGNIATTLNYKLNPLRQLLFLVRIRPERFPDCEVRGNGTILNILQHSINEVVSRDEIENEPFYEDAKIKFVDYSFHLDPPELEIFEEMRIRIFDQNKCLDENVQTHVTYYSKYEIETASIIKLCDQIAKLYGSDNYGDSELQPHELDLVDDSDFWAGRSWLFNTAHGILDLNDPEQSMLYGITITANPDEDGLSLHILNYNKMLDFQALLS
ncbi:MAG TPA: hypothetical protein VGN20_24500 [Mucilaginibacter sp.]|jgi:hypothetical protein